MPLNPRPPLNILLYAPEYRPNLSNMIRTAEFYGLDKIYIYDANGLMDPPSNKVSRADMNHMARVWTAGAIEHIHIEKVDDPISFIQNYNGRSIATVINEKATDLNDFSFEKNDLILLGPEKEGLPQSIITSCHAQVYIRSRGKTDCLNVSVTLGIVMHEALRQIEKS